MTRKGGSSAVEYTGTIISEVVEPEPENLKEIAPVVKEDLTEEVEKVEKVEKPKTTKGRKK